jgi:hypothetical protein
MNVLLTSVLSNEEGDTVCSALTNIRHENWKRTLYHRKY